MNFNAAALELMLNKGLSLADVVEIASANERRADPTATARKRRQRAKERDMSQRDVTRDDSSPIEELLTPPDEVVIDEAIASSPVRQPIAEAIGIWNESAAAAGWPQVQSMSANRNKLLAARLREGGIGGWRRSIARARASPYLGGADPPSWFTFPWLIKSENFLKLNEGNYDRNRSSANVTSLRGSRPDPALDMWRSAVADENEENNLRAGPSLPALGSGGP